MRTITYRTYRMMCIISIRMLFSTLLMLRAEEPARVAGLHEVIAETTSSMRIGLCFTTVPQLFMMAESTSGFLTKSMK